MHEAIRITFAANAKRIIKERHEKRDWGWWILIYPDGLAVRSYGPTDHYGRTCYAARIPARGVGIKWLNRQLENALQSLHADGAGITGQNPQTPRQ